jgi:hypothetical protein
MKFMGDKTMKNYLRRNMTIIRMMMTTIRYLGVAVVRAVDSFRRGLLAILRGNMNNPIDDIQMEREDKVTRMVAGAGIAALLTLIIGAAAVTLLLLFTTRGIRGFDVIVCLFPLWFALPGWAVIYAKRKGHGGWNKSGGELLSSGCEIGVLLALVGLPFIGLLALLETFRSAGKTQ